MQRLLGSHALVFFLTVLLGVLGFRFLGLDDAHLGSEKVWILRFI